MNTKEFALLKLSNLLVIIMTIAIIGSMLLLFFLVQNNKNDGFIINTSGKQRYLSQKITKAGEILQSKRDSLNQINYASDLRYDLNLFKSNNDILLANNNTDSISSLLVELQPLFNLIHANATQILQNKGCETCLRDILEVEPVFLEKMNTIVFEYEQVNRSEINSYLYFILGSNVILICLLWFFALKLMNPAIVKINRYNKIISSQNTRLKKFNADKDTVISILSEDLKKPLLEMLELSDQFLENFDNYSDEVMKGELRNLNGTTRKTYELIEDVLLWANLQSGQLNTKPEQFNFIELTNDVVSRLEKRAKKKNIKIRVFEKEPVRLNLDLNMYKAVIGNLVSNAIKFTHRGGQINVYAEIKASNALITVSDNGIGIAEENIPKIWKITDNFKAKGTNNESGTGFGLKLCKEFVEHHEGEIWVESEFGKGSDFKVSVPINS